MSQHVIKTPNLSLFLGRRNTGKSTLMIHLLRTLAKAQKFAWVRVYSPTAFTGVWGNIVGEDNVEAVFDNDELESILESQAGIRSRGGKNEGLVILDDCLGACSFQNDLWTRIASSGRHYGLTFWVSAQHAFKLPPVIRSNSDYTYLLGVQGDRVVKSYCEVVVRGWWRLLDSDVARVPGKGCRGGSRLRLPRYRQPRPKDAPAHH
jgi:hypothetical protein